MPDRLPSLIVLVGCWVPAACFFVNLNAMPPYIPGTTMDPSYASPEAVRGLAVVTTALVLPGTALACWLAFRSRARSLGRRTAH